ncbi:MAG: penicillin-binding transpeptidase domain-containing protein [Patescibacteria group bacterium]
MAFFRKKIPIYEIDPDEVLLDARNLPSFDEHQFEGRIERPIGKRALYLLAFFFAIVTIIYAGRLIHLQIAQGAEYRELSENNSLRHAPIFSERGIIYDRRGIPLAWNETEEGIETFPRRAYSALSGLAHTIGYVNYPKQDEKGTFYQTELIGKDGVERQYQDILAGTTGIKISEVDVYGEITSESATRAPVNGINVTLTIDAELQSALHGYIKELAGEVGFTGGSGVVMNIETGEILAITSFPEYDQTLISEGKDGTQIRRALNDTREPFLNRALAGLYTPGSTVKPFFGIAALAEKIISPEKQILSTGSISIPNPYNPELKSVFNDWKAHGYVDMRRALAVSSNVYFFEVGGGYKNQKGLGIAKLEEYARVFGLGEATGIDLPGEIDGVIPSPAWKEKYFPNDPWRIGDTYNTAIGQYGFQITPVQLARSLSAIANGGNVITPHVFLKAGDQTAKGNDVIRTVPVARGDLAIVKEGMRLGVTDGIAQALNLSFVEVAAKTGTAEIGAAKRYANSWISGFFPYEKPKYAFAVVMEKGPRNNLKGAVFTMRRLFEWMNVNRREYLQ